jgi:leucyl-tRNA synthetase
VKHLPRRDKHFTGLVPTSILAYFFRLLQVYTSGFTVAPEMYIEHPSRKRLSPMNEQRYPFQEIEEKWRTLWEDRGDHEVDLDNPGDDPRYVLVMFSYPSSSRLHIGHWWNYGGVDTHSRYLRMKGHTVFEPMGFDSFGLPAENYAIKMDTHPKEVTEESISIIREQLKAIGAMYDWRWEVITSRPDYYKWTQWLFLKLYEHGLAYQKDALVNWCPSCQTVLANEQVETDGSCERCGAEVTHRKMNQWFFKITEYADELLEGLKEIDWPESTVKRQENWIGRSTGAMIRFPLESDSDRTIDAFTTRPDTIFGVTYVVLAPEHELVDELTTDDRRDAVKEYIEHALRATEVDRTSTTRPKTGVFTGSYVQHPFTGDRLPVWVADYVLGSYGTGAVMAVPAHDQRDFEFATKFELPMEVVIRPTDELLEVEEMEEAYEGPGVMVNSNDLSGLPNKQGKSAVAQRLADKGLGEATVNYRLRDWSISRQRYWGAPIPMVHCEKCGIVPVPEDQLPIELPDEIDEFRPKGSSPLGGVEEWVNTTCPKCDGTARRDPDTMDTFVCSSFYHLRYLAADRDDAAFDEERMKRWMPISLYVGGPEHGTGHLIYIRFITRFLNKIGICPVAEPAKKLVHQGIITKDGMRMSKSKGNVVNPDEFVEAYGSDVFRMYLQFTGEFTQGGDWTDKGIVGIDRFVNRIWRLLERYSGPWDELEPQRDDYPETLFRTLHNMIKSTGEDLESLSFNTGISRMMELVNELYLWVGEKSSPQQDPDHVRRVLAVLTRVMAPFAPHFAEEAWERLGGSESVFNQPWPEFDVSALEAKTITLVVQVNGKLRDRIEAPADADNETLEKLALESEKVQGFMEGKTVRKIIVVPGKLVNVVIG